MFGSSYQEVRKKEVFEKFGFYCNPETYLCSSKFQNMVFLSMCLSNNETIHEKGTAHLANYDQGKIVGPDDVNVVQ